MWNSCQVYTQTEPVDVHDPKPHAAGEQGDQMLPNLGENLPFFDDLAEACQRVRATDESKNASPALPALIDLTLSSPKLGDQDLNLRLIKDMIRDSEIWDLWVELQHIRGTFVLVTFPIRCTCDFS